MYYFSRFAAIFKKGKQIIFPLSVIAKKKPETEECHNRLTAGFFQQKNGLTFVSKGVKCTTY